MLLFFVDISQSQSIETSFIGQIIYQIMYNIIFIPVFLKQTSTSKSALYTFYEWHWIKLKPPEVHTQYWDLCYHWKLYIWNVINLYLCIYFELLWWNRTKNTVEKKNSVNMLQYRQTKLSNEWMLVVFCLSVAPPKLPEFKF